MNVRMAAARAVTQVLVDGRSLSTVLPTLLGQVAESDRGLLQELVYGVLRRRWRLEALLEQLLKKPLKEREFELKALLLVGLYQLMELSIPAHAAVNETVKVVKDLKKEWARGLVNGVLRNYQRSAERLLAGIDADPQARYDHPDWLIERIGHDWPEWQEAILQANNERAPMTLRVDLTRGSRDDYLQVLDAEGIGAQADAQVESAVVLGDPVPVRALPGFDTGAVTVQDAAAQLAAVLLDPQPGERLLDACCAPGGKTGHLLELQPDLAELVAIDSDEERLRRVDDTLVRLRRAATLLAADAADSQAWWDGQPFDRILLDAPCSASGVIRRHPDIKSLRRESDIPALAEQQARLLDALWPLLAPGGRLLYATCSVLQDENSRQIESFLARTEDALERPIEAAWGHACSHGRQILPGEGDMDGFYYACLEKTG